mgnify:CR=1 FL=1
MRISYAIPVWNEAVELDRLLNQLVNSKEAEDLKEEVDLKNVTYIPIINISRYCCIRYLFDVIGD